MARHRPARRPGRRRIAALVGIEGAGAVVGDAGDDHRQSGRMDQRVLVHQHPQPHAAEFRDPGRGARIVFMVARHQIHAMRRAQLAQRAGLRGQLFDAAVDHVAGDGDEVRRFLVDRVHDGLHVALLDGGADVDVADLHDGEAVQVGRQAGDGHVHRDHAREPARVDEAHDGGRQRQCRHPPGRGLPQRGPAQFQARQAGQPQDQQQRVAQHGEDEQRREQAHRDQPDPGDPVAQGGRAEDRASMPSGIRMQDSASASTAAAAGP